MDSFGCGSTALSVLLRCTILISSSCDVSTTSMYNLDFEQSLLKKCLSCLSGFRSICPTTARKIEFSSNKQSAVACLDHPLFCQCERVGSTLVRARHNAFTSRRRSRLLLDLYLHSLTISSGYTYRDVLGMKLDRVQKYSTPARQSTRIGSIMHCILSRDGICDFASFYRWLGWPWAGCIARGRLSRIYACVSE